MDRLNRWGASARTLFNKVATEAPKIVSAGLTALRRAESGLKRLESAGKKVEMVYESAKQEGLIPQQKQAELERVGKQMSQRLRQAQETTAKLQRVGDTIQRVIK